MVKKTAEQIASRREEIVNACEKLYQTMSFKEITLKEIGEEVPFSRPTIYNSFQTKEEIFLALFEREYDRWNAALKSILEDNEKLGVRQPSLPPEGHPRDVRSPDRRDHGTSGPPYAQVCTAFAEEARP